MASCCHCGRSLSYEPSIRRHSGSWCYYTKGPCLSIQEHTNHELADEREGLKSKLIKGMTKGAITGAAIGVTCLVVHVACLITLFI